MTDQVGQGNTAPQITRQPGATVMFADISGFTALSEKLDPEEVTSIMNACFERLESIIFAHGGVVDEYLGDCIKAAFGFAPAAGSPTVHAVRAALEIRDAMEQFNRDQQLPAPLAVHIGLNTGSVIAVVTGEGDDADFSVVGDTVRLAGRLEDASQKGQIFVGPQTREDSAEEFIYLPLPPLTVDAARPPVAIYELAGVTRARRVTRSSERRQATVLFADLIGVEALARHLDDTRLTAVIQQCFTELTPAVTDHRGVVDKYLGEGLMALFGVPNAIEHAPLHAVNAAIEMRRRLAALMAEQALPVTLALHIGINSGLVIAGDIGGRVKRAFTVMGDTVNLAARLKEAAARDAIYVGPDTYRSTRDDFEFTAVEPLTLKGKEHPVPAYAVVSTTPQKPGRADNAGRLLFSEIVGRDAEIVRVRERLDLLQTGTGGILSIVGEAGIGKSRLLAELLGMIDRREVRALQGGALAIGQGLSFYPFVDLLRNWAGIGEHEADATACAKLEAVVGAVLPDDVAEVFPFVATLMGLRVSGAHAARLAGIEGESLEKLILKSMRELVVGLARRQPLLLIFEDLHWADISSVALLEALMPLVCDHPLLIVQLLRPDFADTGERLLHVARERYAGQHAEILLEGLRQADTARLVHNLLNIPDLPAAVRALIVEKAEGNPFYIEEVVRSLVDAGAIEYRDGGFHVTPQIESVVIPATIQDVIMARVDRLDEPARQLLQIGSVIGRSFYHRLIAALIEREYDLDADLSRLKEKQILLERRSRWGVAVGDRDLVEELEYVFKHALAQETIYSSVLLKTRKVLHGKVAELIQSLFAHRLPDFYGLLAYHYTHAERWEPAHEYHFKAGEEARRAAASNEALQFFREAERIYNLLHGAGGDPKHRAALEKNIGLAMLGKGALSESIGYFDRAIEHLGNPVPRNPMLAYTQFAFDLTAVLFHLYLRGSHWPRKPPAPDDTEFFEIGFNRARALTTSDPQRLFMDCAGGARRLNRIDATLVDQACGMYSGFSLLFAFSGLSFAISERLQHVGEQLIRKDNVRDELVSHSMRFIHHFLAGNWDDRYNLPEALIDENLRFGQFWDVNTYLGLDCDRRLRQGDFAAAHARLQKLAHISATYGYEFAQSNHDGMLTLVLLEERKLEDALRAVDHYYATRHEEALKILALGTKAKIQLLRHDAGGADVTLAAAAESIARAVRVPPWHLSNVLIARLLRTLMRWEEGGVQPRSRELRRELRAALGVAGKCAGVRTEAYRLAGRAAWLRRRPRQAVKWWLRSLDAGERLQARPELARTCLEIGHRLGAAAGPLAVGGVDAAGYLARARTLFMELGLSAELADVDRRLSPYPVDDGQQTDRQQTQVETS